MSSSFLLPPWWVERNCSFFFPQLLFNKKLLTRRSFPPTLVRERHLLINTFLSTRFCSVLFSSPACLVVFCFQWRRRFPAALRLPSSVSFFVLFIGHFCTRLSLLLFSHFMICLFWHLKSLCFYFVKEFIDFFFLYCLQSWETGNSWCGVECSVRWQNDFIESWIQRHGRWQRGFLFRRFAWRRRRWSRSQGACMSFIVSHEKERWWWPIEQQQIPSV